jgi:hypothetical protein
MSSASPPLESVPLERCSAEGRRSRATSADGSPAPASSPPASTAERDSRYRSGGRPSRSTRAVRADGAAQPDVRRTLLLAPPRRATHSSTHSGLVRTRPGVPPARSSPERTARSIVLMLNRAQSAASARIRYGDSDCLFATVSPGTMAAAAPGRGRASAGRSLFAVDRRARRASAGRCRRWAGSA